MKNIYFLIITTILTFSFISSVSAQENSNIDTTVQSEEINLYLDCGWECPTRFIKSNINYVNYVRNPSQANVHLIVTEADLGGGGNEFTLNFIGLKNFSNLQDTLTFNTSDLSTESERRDQFVHNIKLGLMPYLSRTSLAQNVRITVEKSEEGQSEEMQDPWNNWVFEISGDGFVSGRRTHKQANFRGEAEIDRVTKKWKLHYNFDADFNHDTFTLPDGREKSVLKSSKEYRGLMARSLTDHWSLGLYSGVSTSTFNNIDFSAGISPAIEYNIFPYSEYAQRELTFRYRITPRYNKYRHRTIFLENEEFLARQQLSMNMSFTEPWGEIDGDLTAANYMHDFSKNRLSFGSRVDIRIYKGLSLDFSGHYSIINDQITLSSEGTSDEDILLNLREQATSYSYHLSMGLSFTFGSIYNNVVNTRF